MNKVGITCNEGRVLTNNDNARSEKTLSVLNVLVSRFIKYNSPDNPIIVNLLDWLSSREFIQKVDLIRSIADKAKRDCIKATLPAITPSGTFSYRSEESLIKHSGLIQFDIDFKENSHISNYPDLKKQICNIKNVAYCGLSVSGTGFWGLIPLAYPESHKQHFEAIKRNFYHFGIVIDEKPKNVASLRGYSYDKEAYYNHSAEIYYNLYEQPKPQPIELKIHSNSSDTQKLVESCISEIVKNRIDITGGYLSWFEIGCSLSNEFGEAGRNYFHLVSQYYPGYKQAETDKQFTDCLNHKYKFTIATFFQYCKDYGITYK